MNRVVVTGMGVISPVGNDVAAFADNIFAGVCGIAKITRFDTQGHKVHIAGEVKNFDPLLYMGGGDVRKTDLYAQYGLASAVQAMEDSGLAQSGIEPHRLGVYMGSGIGGINTFLSETEKLFTKGPGRVSPFFVPMMIANISAGLIAIRYNAQGPCLPVVTACATATHSIGEAYRAVAYGAADAIIAGGSEAAINPMALAGFANCMALSSRPDPLDASIPFDKRRDGFVIGEGGGALIIEEYGHAKARGAKIYAEICGYGNTCDAYHITAPHPDALCSSRAVRIALDEAALSDEGDIYVNAHGTSTPQNDKIETAALKSALGENAYKCSVSSTKSMTGHMLGGTGAVEAVASLLALEKGLIPPTIGYSEKDPECDLDYTPGKARERAVSAVVSTSFGFGGHNACIVFKKA